MSSLRFGSEYIIILEAPSCSPVPPTSMNEVANPVRLPYPKPANIATFALVMPGAGVGVPICGKGRHKA
jgi:hypothetical protein